MKKDTSHILQRAEHLKTILIGEGLLVGIVAGFVVLSYRLLLEVAQKLLNRVIDAGHRQPWVFALWFLALVLLAFVVSRLLRWEPLISGSGIPQLEGEMTGKLNQTWWKVLPAKFAGGFLCLLGGLSLGREGPSIQLGAMAGKAVSRAMDRGKTEEKYLLTCGASAGLAAAFHAPLAGVMFSLEEIHKNFSVSVLICVMTASLAADLISSSFLGFEPVFQFHIGQELEPQFYWHLLILGILLGLAGVFYNWLTLKTQSLIQDNPRLNTFTRLLIPFLLAGVLAMVYPQILGSGHDLVMEAASGNLMLWSFALLFVGKLLFSSVSFGSGAPGGIFFPLLVLGSLIGGAYATFASQWLGLPSGYISNFVLLAMAGYFTAIVRAPITGIILIFEMTGDDSQMFSLSLVSIAAYLVATLLKSRPIYESLLDGLLRRRGEQVTQRAGERILQEFVVSHGSPVHHKMIQMISWPEHCLLVAIRREGEELIPKGRTIIMAGDTLVTMTDEAHASSVYDRMENLCLEQPEEIVKKTFEKETGES